MKDSPTENPLGAWMRRAWRRLSCRHNWDPIYHSYHCAKCGTWSYD